MEKLKFNSKTNLQIKSKWRKELKQIPARLKFTKSVHSQGLKLDNQRGNIHKTLQGLIYNLSM